MPVPKRLKRISPFFAIPADFSKGVSIARERICGKGRVQRAFVGLTACLGVMGLFMQTINIIDAYYDCPIALFIARPDVFLIRQKANRNCRLRGYVLKVFSWAN